MRAAGFDAGLLPDVQMEHCAGGEESRIVKGVHPVVEIVGRTETKLHVAVMVEQRFGRCFHLHELRTGRDVGIFRRIPADHADGMAALMPGTREIQSDLCVEVAFVIDGVQRSLSGDCRRGDACASRGFGQSLRPMRISSPQRCLPMAYQVETGKRPSTVSFAWTIRPLCPLVVQRTSVTCSAGMLPPKGWLAEMVMRMESESVGKA